MGGYTKDSSGAMRKTQRQQISKITPEEAAENARDHGRKPHELPWLYLDSVGQEYGPIPGWTMREWLQLGRFPVGTDLRVRLPEWEQHLPLHKLYADLSTAFVLPPAWPDFYSDGRLQGEERSQPNQNRSSVSNSPHVAPQQQQQVSQQQQVACMTFASPHMQATPWNGNGYGMAQVDANCTAPVALVSVVNGNQNIQLSHQYPDPSENRDSSSESFPQSPVRSPSRSRVTNMPLPVRRDSRRDSVSQRATSLPPNSPQSVLQRLMEKD